VRLQRCCDERAEIAELSKATTVSPEFHGKPANVAAAIMAGAELGFPPMGALRSVHIIKGIPKLTADAMVAVVLASGKALYFEPSTVTNTSVTFVTKRVGSTREQSCTWSIEDAKRAGLVSDNHRLYPRQMLAARAKSELARSIYPDLVAGLYTEEEVPSDDRPLVSVPQTERHHDAIDAEVVSITEFDVSRIDAATTIEDLKKLVPELNKLKGDARAAAKSRYDERKRALETVAA